MGKSFCLSEFEKWTHHYFKFLLQEGEFGGSSSHQTPVKYFIDFYKKGLLVRITCYLKIDLIDIELFRNPEKIKIFPRNYQEHTTMEALAAYHGHPPADYLNYMPCRIQWQVSLKELAILFRKYAMGIVLGREWISVDMVCHDLRAPVRGRIKRDAEVGKLATKTRMINLYSDKDAENHKKHA